MLTAQAKIRKRDGEPIDETETSVAQALFDLELTSDLKNQLRELQIVGAKEYEIGDKRALALFVPPPQLRAWQVLQTRVVRELEKKFSGKHVVLVAKRTILPKQSRNSRSKQTQKRPISRTLTSVHDAYLSDLVYPAEIIGKRVRVRLDGSSLTKIHLDKASQTNIEHKVSTFAVFIILIFFFYFFGNDCVLILSDPVICHFFRPDLLFLLFVCLHWPPSPPFCGVLTYRFLQPQLLFEQV